KIYDCSSFSRREKKWSEIRCCNRRNQGRRKGKSKGIIMKIKEAYKRLQKKFHPDIAGLEGHEYTLMLNEVYQVLIKDDLRRDYDASIGPIKVQFGKTVSGYSSWKGSLRPQAIFVDANPFIVYSFTPFQVTYIAC
ncbi:DnaJ domain - like 10, partial [Theobroma cacao]